jgi:DNA mismatch repair protein MutL
MSGIIKLLPDHIANQIAAGEVIQRPASVVKEMMENAIDAGATKIQVIIKDAGRTSIRIIDNGGGMNESDANMCFERHATSKVSSADDLFALKTKGFRGEALASIAAIAHVTLSTRQAESDTGIRIEMEGSKVTAQEAIVCAAGASFDVKNLFFNVPARRNFLKSDSVEFGHIRDEFERIALAHADIGFVLKHNDNEIYHLHPGVLRKRIVDILGKSSNDKLVPIEESTDIVRIMGYVGKPEFSKKSRGEQFLFVNQRFFRDNYFNNAITKAFEGLIPPKFFPSYFLYLEVDPSKIDVNVHPTKTEIKFEEDTFIYRILLSSIRQALGKYNISPTLDFDRETSFDLPLSMKDQPAVEPVVRVNPDFNPFRADTTSTSRSSSGNHFTQAIKAEGFGNRDVTPTDWDSFYRIEEKEEVTNVPLIQLEEDFSEKPFILSGRYAFIATENGILVADIRRAYEKVVYEDLLQRFISSPVSSQQLLFPYQKELVKEDQEFWKENEKILKRFGFDWSIQGHEIHLTAVPSILEQEEINECLDRVLEHREVNTVDHGEIAHALALSIATSGSKRIVRQSQEAIRDILARYFKLDEGLSPEGKKVIISISAEELNKRF